MAQAFEKQWEFLKEKFENGTLAHAYIFSGVDVEAVKIFAKEFTEFIGCKFPDVMTIKSADSKSSVENGKDMMEISIEQIREAQQFLTLTAFYGKHKTVIVEDADRMSVQAQNCFLKNLEEPRGNSLVLLVAQKPEMLLPTISSRCQQMKFLGAKKFQPTEKEQKMLQELLVVMKGSLAEKFAYAKTANLEGDNFKKILGLLQWHFRGAMLEDLGLGNNKKIVKLIEQLSHRAEVSNASSKLALEILLMEV